MNTGTDDRIFHLWETMSLLYVPEGHEKHQAGLASLAAKSPGDDILSADDAAADWLREQLHEAATAYLHCWAKMQDFTIVSRAVVHGHSDYQPLTNHPDAYLSGIYFVTVPEGLRDAHHRSDARSNAISLYDPRFGMNMGAIARDPNADMEKQMQPAPGMLTLWPSYVDFFIHPNLSAEEAVSVHFKVILGGVS